MTTIRSYACDEGHFHDGTGKEGRTCPDRMRAERMKPGYQPKRRGTEFSICGACGKKGVHKVGAEPGYVSGRESARPSRIECRYCKTWEPLRPNQYDLGSAATTTDKADDILAARRWRERALEWRPRYRVVWQDWQGTPGWIIQRVGSSITVSGGWITKHTAMAEVGRLGGEVVR